jgi:hypothetical protein
VHKAPEFQCYMSRTGKAAVEAVRRVVRTFPSVMQVSCHRNNRPMYLLIMTLNKFLTQVQKTPEFQCCMNRTEKADVEAARRVAQTFPSIAQVSYHWNTHPQ